MSLKSAIMEKARQIENRENANTVMPGSAYNRFFEGYIEYTVPRENGRGEKIIRVYAGKYYSQKLSAKAKTLVRVLYAVILIAGASLLYCAALRDIPANSAPYAAVCYMISLYFVVRQAASLIRYIVMPKKATLPEYKRSSGGWKIFSVGSAACSAASSISLTAGSVANSIMTPDALLCAAMCAVSAGIFLSGFFIERAVKYELSENEINVPRNAVRIH